MDDTHRKALLALARQTMEARLGGRPERDPPAGLSIPGEYRGAFVTIHNGGRLRGCIGRFDCPGGVVATVQQMALASLQDPRFVGYPVTLAELPQIRIEISLLSPMRRASAEEFEPGVHGIYIRQGRRAGCFLPQVAGEMGWGREQMLSRCCADKAGLAPDAWKDPATEVYLFTAEKFSED